MLTKMAVTFGSLVMRSKADLIASGVAPPPTSKKFAGDPPLSLMISMVAMASPAPLTRQPMSPSSLMKFKPCLKDVSISSCNFNSCLLCCLHFISVLLRRVSPRKDFLLSILCIVVKVELGVHGQYLMVARLGQWIDLDLCCIFLHEDLV